MFAFIAGEFAAVLFLLFLINIRLNYISDLINILLQKENKK